MCLIALEGLEFYSFHGEYVEENKIGGRYIIDAYLESNINLEELDDNLAETADYEQVYNIIASEMEVYSKLIETVGYRIISRIKEEITCDAVTIRISKLHPPLKGVVKRAFVELKG